ncbi:MAG: hypothetical protein AAF456_20575 [Planctomycetota bacterium]
MRDEGDLLDRLSEISIRGILLHPVFLFLIATTVVVTTAIATWGQFRDDIVQVEDFRLEPRNIVVSSPPPAWTSDDEIKQLVLSRLDDTGASTLNADLVPGTAGLFQSVGWVESIRRIEKTRDQLEIDLVYRNPVGLVKIGGQRPWLPVDREGVIFDGNLVRASQPESSVVENFLLIYVFQPEVAGLSTWQQWPDSRIQGAARISEWLVPHWQRLGIKQIVSLHAPGEPAMNGDYELRPRNGDEGTVIVWGNAPGMEATGEATPAQKIAAINEYVTSNGPLENAPQRGLVVDVRSGSPVLAVKIRTAGQQEILRTFK